MRGPSEAGLPQSLYDKDNVHFFIADAQRQPEDRTGKQGLSSIRKKATMVNLLSKKETEPSQVENHLFNVNAVQILHDPGSCIMAKPPNFPILHLVIAT